MKSFKDIKVLVALSCQKELSHKEISIYNATACDLARFFHNDSTCCRYHGENNVNRGVDLLKAALMEDFRINGYDYLIWLPDFRKEADLKVFKEAAHILIYKGYDMAQVTVNVTPNPDNVLSSDFYFIIFSMEKIKEYCSKLPESEWLDIKQSAEIFLYNQIKLSGALHREIAVTSFHNRINPFEPYRLPLEVDFVSFASGRSDENNPDKNAAFVTILGTMKSIISGKRTALFGTGVLANSLMSLIKENVSVVADNNAEVLGKNFHGITVVSPESLQELSHAYDIVVLTEIDREMETRAVLKSILKDTYNHIEIIGFGGLVESAKRMSTKSGFNNEILSDIETKQQCVKRKEPKKTKNRELTKRGVLYVGYPCNIRCVFCYYAYSPSKEWHSLDECKRDTLLYKSVYNNNRIDITGGEPTVYPHILPLLDYCRSIDILPSLITNMQALADKNKLISLKDHGVYDFLCSIHALGDTYDMITKKRGGWKNIVAAVDNLNSIDMKWRANCTMTSVNKKQLKGIACFAYENNARVINYISYNPFYEWAEKMDIDFQASHSEISPYLLETLDYCDEVGLEANVRYFPFCMMKRHENKCYNYSQLSYDSHEWDFCSWFSEHTRNPSSKAPDRLMKLVANEEEFHLYMSMRTREISFRQSDSCRFCAMSFICDGFTSQYAKRFGLEEMMPYDGALIEDHIHFIRNQEKVVDL